MSAKRPKIDHMSTAAFAASQPLFETLRNARERLPDQGMYLTMATNLVQRLHVGLQIEDGTNDIERHAKYMDAIVEAWRCATDTYCDVFSQLASITAEKSEEGRSAAASHVDFAKMLESARLAQKTAKDYTLAREKADIPLVAPAVTTKAEAANASSSDSEAEETKSSSQFPPSQPTPTPAAKKSCSTTKYDRSGLRLLWEEGELKVPLSSLSKDEKKEWNMVQKKFGRLEHKKKIAHIAKGQQHTNGVDNTVKPTQTGAGDLQPQAAAVPLANENEEKDQEETAALAAEAVTRIKAKEEIKRAKKAERKRKRESGDSFIGHEHETASLEQAVVSDKPQKKKAKKSDPTSVLPAAPPAEPASNPKRKSGLDEGKGNANGNADAEKPSKRLKKNNKNNNTNKV